MAQQQRLTQQQMMVVRMLEMPLAELEQAVQTEIDDNPALEVTSESPEGREEPEVFEASEGGIDEERRDELDAALQRMTGDDDMPLEPETWNLQPGTSAEADYEEIVYGNQTSFFDILKEQMMELELSDEQRQVMEYIIGSLDNDGLLRKSLDTICDELAIYQNVDMSMDGIEKVLRLLQGFDPAGIGARDLQECLLLQIDRKVQNSTLTLLRRLITAHFDDLMSNRWDRIAQQMDLSEDVVESLKEEIVKLNPKPGASLGETEGRNVQQITPDFIVDTSEDGTVSFTINRGRVPELYVSPSFVDMLSTYQQNKEGMNRQTKEALLYAKEKVDRARNYIEAIKQRRHTLYVTMKTIIDLQLKFFQEGDEGDIRPMVLKDVADRTGLDISTVSRVCNVKYCQTRWGTFRLRHFFNEGLRTENGETLSTRKVKQLLREFVEAENKQQPLNDDTLSAMLKEKGYPVARRTVAKYREQLGIPIARMRKK